METIFCRIHSVSDQIQNPQNSFTIPNKNLCGEGASDRQTPAEKSLYRSILLDEDILHCFLSVSSFYAMPSSRHLDGCIPCSEEEEDEGDGECPVLRCFPTRAKVRIFFTCLGGMSSTRSTHYTENQIYVFPEKELHDNARPQCQFLHSCVCEQFIYSQDRSTYSIWLQKNRQTDPGNIKISHRYMSIEIGRQNIIVLFWK